MAIITCKECRNPVSTEAKACPGCGAKPPKQTSLATILFGGAFTVAVGMMVFMGGGKIDIPHAVAAPAIKSAEGARFDFVMDTTRAVRQAMRNPESLKWESVKANDAGTVACLQYRSQNGFGGMGRETVVVANNKVSNKASDLKKHCSQPMHDEIAAAQ